MNWVIKDPISREYGEVPQANPIRWELFYRNEANELEPQTGQFKCKDFFNDVIGWYYGVKGRVYSFDTTAMTFNEDGLYIRVHNIKWPLQWLSNIENTVQKPLERAVGARLDITLVDLATYIIFVPRAVLANTYYISLLTYLIRISNNDYLYESIKQVFTDRNGPSFKTKLENELPEGFRNRLANTGFQLPEPLGEYWYYVDPSINSKKEFDLTSYMSMLHNNGMCNWAQFFKE